MQRDESFDDVVIAGSPSATHLVLEAAIGHGGACRVGRYVLQGML